MDNSTWYRLSTALKLAMDSIRAHKLRSFLTLLGVIVGVSSVVLVGSAIEGLGLYAEKTTATAFGTDSFLVAQIASVGRLTRKEVAEKLRYNKQLRQDDIDYLRLTTGDSVLYTPYQQRGSDVKRDELIFEAAVVIGVSASLPEIRDVAVIDGRFFTEQEEKARQQVCVIGDDIRLTLFPSLNPIGRSLKLQGLDFTVIGVQDRLGNAGGRSQDNSVYIPATVYARLFGKRGSLAVFAAAKPGTPLKMEDALDLTRGALRSRFKTPPGKPDRFDTLTPDSIRSFVDSILGLIAAVVVPVTCISLVVGGIVIMNIMLVSVTERTREIGVRKSLGAKQNDILLQFLLEAALVSAVGGFFGLMVGWALVQGASQAFGAELRLSWVYIVLALGASSAVGLISGWYPARRAARLDPVVALRAE